MDFKIYFTVLLSWISLLEFAHGLSTVKSCARGTCAPDYGNLIIGREHRLSASSTCGLVDREKFCVVTSLQGHKKCFWCGSSHRTNKTNSDHGIANVVAPIIPNMGPSNKPWWQSQSGIENVTIRLDLETVFYFSYLYLKFKTFRPAGMLVERSADHGVTWQVYGYFAENCAKQFPWAPVGEQKNLTVPYCTEKYSSFLPFENGEVILRTLPSVVESTIDPFSEEVQNLVKFTNLRINFTKLHTLGDDLLDNRTDIKEKYYYAVYEMLVGGTCACYGHADRCLPLEGVTLKPNMVHGRCECTHNTKGFNCDKCEDLYNDHKWTPAFGKQKNICKKCECNNHATSCHFDQNVFDSTGKVSGGVCDNCQHFTAGRNCEQCKHYYYQDPQRDFSDPYICIPCNCDPTGSQDEGICDSRTDPANGLVSGQCHCKENVDGRRCDTCKNGFWNLNETNPHGCVPCSCNLLGTHQNQGCNKDTGECECKRNVVGRDCNQCIPKFWGLGDSPEGCKPCQCDPGGSLDEYCDVITGQCKCRPNLTGRTCNEPVQTYYTKGLDFMISEAEIGSNCSGTCTIEIRAPYPDGYSTSWTGPGFVRLNPPSTIDFPIDPIRVDAEFNIVIRYEPQVQGRYVPVKIFLIRPDDIDPNGYCARKSDPITDTRETILRPEAFYAVIDPTYCLEANKNYTVRLQFLYDNPNAPSATILIDSILLSPDVANIPFINGPNVGPDRLRDFEYYRCADTIYSPIRVNLSEVCRLYHYSIGSYLHNGGYACECDSTGSYSSLCNQIDGYCNCKPNVVGRRCNICAPGTYGFGPEGCKACDCHTSGSLDNFCDVYSGQCKCRPQTYGRSCDLCQPGSWNYPNCVRCICQGHADTCDSRTGACIDCQNHTEGFHCDRCMEGYYGDPRFGINGTGIDIPCRRCPCPGTVESGHSFAQRCALDSRSQDVICECSEGYAGARCDSCSENYFGNPEVLGGKCAPCNCSNNIDIIRPGNCDRSTGKCLRCLYNTDGFHCEYCQAGFFGDALQQTCRPCVCDLLGTDPKQSVCDKFTGQCSCLPNVMGQSCNQCIANHWKIASGAGCEPCACDPNGSEAEQCNQFDGQCQCKPGFGGRKCDQCQANFWGNPRLDKCKACDCNPEGAASFQCNQTTGECSCMLGIGGVKCDECARGYIGHMPRCTPCGECFDNWDAILNDLKKQTKIVVENATEIMKTGASGSYLNEFEAMERKLDDVKQVLLNTSASSQKLAELEKKIENVKQSIITPEQMNNVKGVSENITQRIHLNSLAVRDLQEKANMLNETTRSLKENATKLQEGNVEGALNLIRDAHDRASLTKQKNELSIRKAVEAQQTCKRTESLIGRLGSQFTKDLEENDGNLQKLNEYLNEIEARIPSLNKQLCDKMGNPCDALCGGAGCGFCGGLSCDEGALTKAENALQFAKNAEKEIKDKDFKLGELYRGVTQARTEAKNAYNASQNAHQTTEVVNNEFARTLNQTNEMIKQLEDFANNSASTPAEIRKKADETLQKNIQLRPDQILELAQKINETVSSLTDINAIIIDTETDLSDSRDKKHRADNAYERAKNVLNVTEKVLSVLNEAEQFQKMADAAIESANSNITMARKSLVEISQASTKAQQNMNETMIKFSDLNDKFRALQVTHLKNNAAAQKVAEELINVAQDVDSTLIKTDSLTKNYEAAVKELDDRSSHSTKAFQNAQTLAEDASNLLLQVKKKIQELDDYEKFFTDQDESLNRINANVQSLTDRIKNTSEVIRTRSDFYQTCTT